MKERIIEAIRAVPIAEYQSYAEYVEALAEELQREYQKYEELKKKYTEGEG